MHFFVNYSYSSRYILYCIMRPYAEGRLDRYRIGYRMSEIRSQP